MMNDQDNNKKFALLIDLIGTEPNTIRGAAKKIFSECAFEYVEAYGDCSIALETTKWMELLDEIDAFVHRSTPRPPRFSESSLIAGLRDLRKTHHIIGIGNSQTPKEFQKACYKFIE